MAKACCGVSCPVRTTSRNVETIDVFHQKIEGALNLSKFVDGNDVRMAEFRQGSRLPRESQRKFDIVSEFFWQNLQGNKAVESWLTRLVDRPHASRPNQLHNFQGGK